MEGVGTGASGEEFDTAAGTTVFSVEVGAEELEFADGFDGGTRFAGDDAATFNAGGGDAIDKHFLAAAGGAGNLRVAGIAGDAGGEEGELFEVALFAGDEEGEFEELGAVDGGAEIGGGSLERGDVAGDIDGLFDGAEFERGIEGDGLGNVEADIGVDIVLEAGGFDGDFVDTDGELLEDVIAGGAGDRFIGDGGGGIAGGDVGLGDAGAGGIGDAAGDGAKGGLGLQSQGGGQSSQQNPKHYLPQFNVTGAKWLNSMLLAHVSGRPVGGFACGRGGLPGGSANGNGWLRGNEPGGGRLFVRLRNELFAHGLEGGEGLVEGAVVGVLVAQEQVNLMKFLANEGESLEADGAVHEPMVLGHVGDEELFDGGGGAKVCLEGEVKGFEDGGIFIGDEEDAGGEAVFDCIFAAGGLAGVGAGAGGGVKWLCGSRHTPTR